ncbi:hypothetical protein CNR37_00006 [Pseudomonas phage ventosus]|uniref:Head decoration protein n=1 Tax=Pseudomonas phage ventosus TaxID=2048980 RepID=A0A2H4P7R5_9CAUD|nr:hypothetical protein CNR37_00006 [Pseudomonas phage ventosus]
MATYAGDTQRLSNWLKWEEFPDSGTTREVINKSQTNATITGSVLDSNFQLVVPATVGDASYILIDDLTRPSAAEFTKALVLARGKAKVGKRALIFGAGVSDANKLTAFTKLATLQIFAVDQIDVSVN